MGSKSIRKGMAVIIMEVLIVAFIAVQTSDLVLFSCLPSSLAIPLTHSYDHFDDEPAHDSSIGGCLREEIKICTENHPPYRHVKKYESCIVKAFENCRNVHKDKPKGTRDPKEPRDLKEIQLVRCIDTCFHNSGTKRTRNASRRGRLTHFLTLPKCLLDCFDRHERGHSDVFYAQHPRTPILKGKA